MNAAFQRLADFLTTDPDRPCGWAVLTISRDGSRRWQWSEP